MLQTIKYNTPARLPCGYTGAGVVIGCSPSLVLPISCAGGGTFTPSNIYGTILSEQPYMNPRLKKTWQYMIQFDDAQLNSDSLLTTDGIRGLICVGVQTQWVLDQIALSKCRG